MDGLLKLYRKACEENQRLENEVELLYGALGNCCRRLYSHTGVGRHLDPKTFIDDIKNRWGM